MRAPQLVAVACIGGVLAGLVLLSSIVVGFPATAWTLLALVLLVRTVTTTDALAPHRALFAAPVAVLLLAGGNWGTLFGAMVLGTAALLSSD